MKTSPVQSWCYLLTIMWCALLPAAMALKPVAQMAVVARSETGIPVQM